MYSNLGVLKGFIYREGGMGNQGTSKATVLVFTFLVFLNSGKKERKSEKREKGHRRGWRVGKDILERYRNVPRMHVLGSYENKRPKNRALTPSPASVTLP